MKPTSEGKAGIAEFDRIHVQPLIDAIVGELMKRGAAFKLEHKQIKEVNDQPIDCHIHGLTRFGLESAGKISVSYKGARSVRLTGEPAKLNAGRIAANLIAAAEKRKVATEADAAEWKQREQAAQALRNLEHDAGLPKHAIRMFGGKYELSMHDLTREQVLAIGKAYARTTEAP